MELTRVGRHKTKIPMPLPIETGTPPHSKRSKRYEMSYFAKIQDESSQPRRLKSAINAMDWSSGLLMVNRKRRKC
jgi:hypothetical protein